MGKAFEFSPQDCYRSQARQQAGRTPSTISNGAKGSSLPLHHPRSASSNEAGRLSETHGRDSASQLAASNPLVCGSRSHGRSSGGARKCVRKAEEATHNDVEDAISQVAPPPAPPPDQAEPTSSGHPTVTNSEGPGGKAIILSSLVVGIKRFGMHTRNALFRSRVNVLLILVPVGIAVKAAHLNAAIVFAVNAVAIVPLAGLLSHATESVASRLGDTLGALLNVSFGNAVELIIFIIALVKNEIRIVQASLLGSILANLLLILGMAFLFGGLRFREQIYNSTVTQMSACLLSLSVTSLLLPTAFYASFNSNSQKAADAAVLRISRGTSVVLLLVYILYLLFQLKSHAYMYESTPQEIIDEESHPGVLADMLGSSSSSDTSSSSNDSDSDTSGSLMTTGKRIRKKMFRSRRRRKSSASASSTAAPSVVPSALSSPSTTEQQSSCLEHQINDHGQQESCRESAFSTVSSGDEADADLEHGGGHLSIDPRVRDFVKHTESAFENGEESKWSERRKRRKKRRHRKHHKTHADQPTDVPLPKDLQKDKPEQHNSAAPKEASPGPRVGFADDVRIAETDGPADMHTRPLSKLSRNMGQLSSRATYRPALPKVLSNTVFTTPAPIPEYSRRPLPAPISRIRTEDNGLRRTSSLPDRLNRQTSNIVPTLPAFNRSDPLPPFHHQRARTQLHRTNIEDGAQLSESRNEEARISRTAPVVILIVSTVLVAVCAEFMVDAIPSMIAASPVSQAFIGLIILPIVGNAAEHVTAVTVATKNKMDLAIGVAVGSSIQIALFVTPVVVLLGWILHTDMSLYFNLFETISLFVTAFVVNFLVLDGRSNYLEGSLLIAAYIIIAVGAFYYPSADAQSAIGGGASES